MIGFFSKPLFETAFRHDLRRPTRTSKMRGPNLIRRQRRQRECCPSKNKMIHRSIEHQAEKVSRTMTIRSSNRWMKMEVELPSKIVIHLEYSTKDHHGIVDIFFSVSKESSLPNSPRTLIFFGIKAMKLPNNKFIVELQGFSTWKSQVQTDLFI